MEKYSRIYDDYIQKKIGEVAIKTRIPLWVWTWFRDSQGPYSGQYILNSPKEYEGDKSDFPRFTESKPSLIIVFNDSSVDIAGLLLWNIVLAMGAFLAFNRADVR